MLPIQANNEITMTSLELVEFINSQRNVGEAELQHKHFLEKVKKVLGEPAENLAGLYKAGNGQMQPCYKFPKREACLMAMSYSYDLQAKVFDKMTALESGQYKIPTTLSSALRLAASQAELLEVQTQIIEQQKPAVQFVERYVESSGNKGFREVCKLLKVKENQFREFLIDQKIMYRLGGNLTPYSDHIDASRFETNAGISAGEHAYTQAKFTPKGINWVAGLWAVYNLESAMAEAA
ncbi:MAG: phage antirepressor KilAC domain-containing protein [Candidatus Methylopumilus sp.]|jgi:phage antirepressor YoqD-like protein